MIVGERLTNHLFLICVLVCQNGGLDDQNTNLQDTTQLLHKQTLNDVNHDGMAAVGENEEKGDVNSALKKKKKKKAKGWI